MDQDATLVETTKRDKAYQPLNTWWAEQGSILHTEFRDGNVPAGYEQLRVLLEALALLPAGVEKVRLRSDTAGYQHELLKYCAKGENKRFGRIEFAIDCDVTPEFKKAVLETEEKDWQPIYKEFDTPCAPKRIAFIRLGAQDFPNANRFMELLRFMLSNQGVGKTCPSASRMTSCT